MEMKQSICDKDCFHCRFSDCVNHYGPYTEAKDIKKALNGQKKSRPRDWHHEEIELLRNGHSKSSTRKQLHIF